MKLLANENIPLASVIALQTQGFDIKAIGVDHRGVTDEQVVDIAISEDRTIVTYDSDYGELIFKHGYRPAAGVIYIRIPPSSPEAAAEVIKKLVTRSDISFRQILTVVDQIGIRQKKY